MSRIKKFFSRIFPWPAEKSEKRFADLEVSLSQIKQAVDAEARQSAQAMQQFADDSRRQHEAVLESVKDLRLVVDAFDTKIAKAAASITEDLRSQIQASREQLSALIGSAEGSLRRQIRNAISEREASNAQLSALIESAEGSLRRQIRNAISEREASNAQLSAAIEAVAGSLRRQIRSVISENQALMAPLSAAIESAEGSLRRQIRSVISESQALKGPLSAAIEAAAGSLRRQIKSVIAEEQSSNERLSAAIESTADSLRGQIRTIISEGEASNAQLVASIESASGAQRRQIRKIIDDTELLAANHGALAEKADLTIRTINDMRSFYYYPREVESAEQRGLCDMPSRPDFEAEYTALVQGLPDESVAAVNRIICRLNQIKGLKGRKDLYTEEEKRQLKEVERFSREVLSISEERHCWHRYLLPVNHFSPNVFLYRYGMDLIGDPSRFEKKTIIDVGAYIGDSALILSEYTSGKVYCFEASQKNHAKLLSTISMNRLDRVVPENLALGSEEGEIVLRECDDRSSTDAIMVPDPHSVETCRMTTLDSYVQQHGIDVGLIKVDIEGAEQDFLKGAVATIREQRPVLLISIYHNADDFLKIKPYIESLDLGYGFRIYHPVIRSVVAETLLICEQKAEAPKRTSGQKRNGRKSVSKAEARSLPEKGPNPT